MPLFGDFQQEIADSETRAASRRQAELLASRIDEQQAQNISDIAGYHPYLDPGTTVALGSTGQGPFSAITQFAAQLKVAMKAESASGFAEVGDYMRASLFANAPEGSLAQKNLLAQYGAPDSTGRTYTPEELKAMSRQMATQAPHAQGLVKVPDRVVNAVKTVTKVADAAGNYPKQVVQGVYGEYMNGDGGALGGLLPGPSGAGAERIQKQTDAGQIGYQAIAAVKAGEVPHIDTGTGFFVGGQVAEARKEAERLYRGTTSDGHTRTIGRDFAGLFTEPGSKPYTIISGLADATVAIEAGKADPLTRLAQGNKADNAFTSVVRQAEDYGPSQGLRADLANIRGEIGALDGSRRTYDAAKVESYLTSSKGERLVDAFTDTTDIKTLDKLTGGKLEPELLTALADSTDADATRALLRQHLGLEIVAPPKLGPLSRFGDLVSESSPRSLVRLTSKVPSGGLMDTEDGRAMLTQTERMLRNANADEETVSLFMNKMARSSTKSEKFEVLKEMAGSIADDIATKLGGSDAARAEAKRMTTYFYDSHDAARKYFVNAIGDDVATLDDTLNPQLLSEHLNRYVPVPDQREIRRTLSLFGPVTSTKAFEVPESTAEWVQQTWKKSALARIAYPQRVLMDEQARMMAGDMTNVFSHPIGYIAWVLGGNKNRVARMLEKAGVEGRGSVDVTGELFQQMDEHAAALVKAGKLIDEPGAVAGAGKKLDKIYAQHYVVFDKTHTNYTNALADELRTLHADPIGREVAAAFIGDGIGGNGDVYQAAKDAVWVRQSAARAELAAAHPGSQWDLATRAGSDAYVDSVIDRLNVKTGGNRDLIGAVATGKIGAGEDAVRMVAPGTPFINGDFTAKLGDYADVTPQKVRGPDYITVSKGKEKLDKEHRDNAVNAFFGYLFGKPDNYLSRSKEFREEYWKQVVKYAPTLDPAEADELMKNANLANLSKSDLRRLEYLARKAPTGDRVLSLEQLGNLAKGHALDNTKKLLYDVSERSQFFDATRLVFPFGEAWSEFLQIWPKLLAEKPRLVAQAHNALEVGRDPELGAMVGAPTGKGFLYRDSNDNEVFGYPASASIVKHLMAWNNAVKSATGIGLPGAGAVPVAMPLEGRLQGLSMGLDVMPGVGPVASLPLGYLHSKIDDPQYDGLWNIVFPYGAPKSGTDIGSIMKDELTPAWMRKMFMADGGFTAQDQVTMAHMQQDVQAHLISTGTYKINGSGTPEEMQAEMNRLTSDAKKTATAMMMIRGGAQFASPSAPAYRWEIEDKSGQRLVMQPLINEFRQLQQDDQNNGTNTAIATFLDKYGQGAMQLMQGKTMPVSAGVDAPTDALDKWVRENPDVKKSLPLVYGFFAPNDREAGYSSNAYMRQVADGERVSIKPEAAPRLANDMIAKSIYYQAHDQLLEARGKDGFSSLSATQSAGLAALNEALRQKYPGYQDTSWDPTQTIKPAEYIRQLKQAIADPKLKDDPLTASIAGYMKVRDAVIAKSTEILGTPTGYTSSKDGTALRAVLTATADSLAAKDPRFNRVYERVFQAEIQTGLVADENRNVVGGN